MIKVAAFDLDGTILDGESPLIMSQNLLRHRQMSLRVAAQMAWWGIRYRLRLPQTETTPRELLFSCLTDQTVEEVDDEILTIYTTRIFKLIRNDARKAVESCRKQGMFLVLASASFKPITDAIVAELDLDAQVSTTMEEIDGHYTARVAGNPVQGQEKMMALESYCDMKFGAGNWVLETAYSDHYSDLPLLENALHPIIVDPDNKLERIAKKRNWPILKWS